MGQKMNAYDWLTHFNLSKSFPVLCASSVISAEYDVIYITLVIKLGVEIVASIAVSTETSQAQHKFHQLSLVCKPAIKFLVWTDTICSSVNWSV